MSRSRNSLVAVCTLVLCGALFSPSTLAYDIEIDVAPNVLNIQSASVFLNGVAISHWKADNRGNFVAKFSSDEIKVISVIPQGKN